ncbi:MAG: hypothetical protein WBA57_23140 [Elainellaceae cyanobacterium]
MLILALQEIGQKIVNTKEETISFEVKLNASEWDSHINAWRCAVLGIPGAEVERIVHKDRVLQPDYDYALDSKHKIIQWISNESRPTPLVVFFKLTKELSTQKNVDNWKRLTVILTSTFSFLSVIATLLAPSIGEMTKITLGHTDYPKANHSTSSPGEDPEFETVSLPETQPVNVFQEMYEQGQYPRGQCGSVTRNPIYPIFVPDRSDNLNRIISSFCSDARLIGGKIQVASFSSEEEAEMFLEFIEKYFDGAWKGPPQ